MTKKLTILIALAIMIIPMQVRADNTLLLNYAALNNMNIAISASNASKTKKPECDCPACKECGKIKHTKSCEEKNTVKKERNSADFWAFFLVMITIIILFSSLNHDMKNNKL